MQKAIVYILNKKEATPKVKGGIVHIRKKQRITINRAHAKENDLAYFRGHLDVGYFVKNRMLFEHSEFHSV